jgi:cytochrome P450
MPRLVRTEHPFETDVDISSVAFWSRPFEERDRAFARLRAESPVSWHPPLETPALPPRYREAGFWAVTRSADIARVSRDHETFSSELGQVAVRPAPFPIDPNMLVLDPPRHTLFRRLLHDAFTPRAVAAIQAQIDRMARQIVLRAAMHRSFDFVPMIAAQLPLRTIAQLLGVPSSERDRFVRAGDAYASGGLTLGDSSGVTVQDQVEHQMGYLRALCAALVELRRRQPEDDLMTRLASVEMAGRRLTDDEILSTVLLLIVAGNDTTKQATTLGLLALHRNPEQTAWLLEDFEGRFDAAFEELVRYASPVLCFARTATRDVVLGGRQVVAGDKVALFYCSGNRDEAVFPDPGTLDLRRAQLGGVAFGGGGVHFCLGSVLARAQIRAILREVFARMPGLTLGEPEFGFSEFTHIVEALPATNDRRPRGG